MNNTYLKLIVLILILSITLLVLTKYIIPLCNNWILKKKSRQKGFLVLGAFLFSVFSLIIILYIKNDYNYILWSILAFSSLLFLKYILFSKELFLERLIDDKKEQIVLDSEFSKDNSIDEKEKISFNKGKNPHDFYTFLEHILNPKTIIEKEQIEKFINNCFTWNTTKYSHMKNVGDTITFLDKEKVKILSGFIWFACEKTAIFSQEKTYRATYIEKILVEELKEKNKINIGLSIDSLRKNLNKNSDFFKENYPLKDITNYKIIN